MEEPEITEEERVSSGTLVKTFGSAVHGVDATTITVEVNVSQGMKYFLVGLPDSAVKESQQRIEAALKNNGYRMPRQRIVVNMAPADITVSTNSTALRMTPTWQASNTSARSGRRGAWGFASGNADKIWESFIRNVAFGPIIGDPCPNTPGSNQ